MADYPRTMKEFVAKWERKIEKIVASHGMSDHVEDIKQDIYLKMCEPSPENGKTGLENYDPQKASFSTYAYRLIMLKVQNARAQWLKDRHHNPVSHDVFIEDDSNLNSWQLSRMEKRAAAITGDMGPEKKVQFWVHMRNVKEVLRTHEHRSSFFRDGECVVRDLSTLLELILAGKSREEIVTYFNYSTGSVGVLFDQLRSIPEVIELQEFLVDMA